MEHNDVLINKKPLKPAKPGSKRYQLEKAAKSSPQNGRAPPVSSTSMKSFAPSISFVESSVLFVLFNSSTSLKACLGHPHIFYEGGELQGPLKGVNMPSQTFLEWSQLPELEISNSERAVLSLLSSFDPEPKYIVGCLESDRMTLHHEWCHSRFYLDEEYKILCHEVWNSFIIGSNEKGSDSMKCSAAVRYELKMRGYKEENYCDEFQAYLVAEGSSEFGRRWKEQLESISHVLREKIGEMQLTNGDKEFVQPISPVAKMFSRLTVPVVRCLPRCHMRPLSFPLAQITTSSRANVIAHVSSHRSFASAESPSGGEKKSDKTSGGTSLVYAAIAAFAAAGAYYMYSGDNQSTSLVVANKPLEYQLVYNKIASILENNDYDDGSYAPVLIRLAWHASGTYDKSAGNGGSNGSTMRFGPEASDGANAGLQVARDLLEPIKKEFPEISYADLWTLAGVVAIQEMGGPTIPWRAGRTDAVSVAAVPPQGRLPDASKDQSHVRQVFNRMGFNDQEMVALIGAHAVGRCHTDRSGFDGPWTFSPISFTNDYFKRLVEDKWVEKKWNGPKQFADKATGNLMMLPADIALIKDKGFKKYVDIYAKNEQKFFDDFASAFSKLIELGVSFKEDAV
ncbi:heme peroxidase, partial [Nowakowskiella sp. JEL0078]